MADRANMLRRVQAADFAVEEAALFLDTHPKNDKALAYYKAHQALRKKTVDEYERLYGPLTVFGNESQTEWKWIDSPWPWEMED
ncbi:MAG: spore coat protein CotJB [Bacillota bacterium]|nr:spore coat protein CotJB [Bacillota bacterium]